MKDAVMNLLEENEAIRDRITEYGLDVRDFWQPYPEDAAFANRRLRELLKWVRAYRECPDREKLARMGFHFPPVEPDIDPDSDWLRFERWMNGKPLVWKYAQDVGPIAPDENLTEEELELRVDAMEEALAGRGVCIDLQPDVPVRLVYRYLRKELGTGAFEVAAPGSTCHLTGCDGYCPGCFQRPWCDLGNSSCWTEDEDAGQMVVPPEIAAFVEPGALSLEALREADPLGAEM